MKTTIDELGTIDLSGTVVVSDPCYDREVWCMMPGVKVRPGRYRVFVARQNEGRFGIRIACLMAVHDDYEAAEINNWDDDCSGSIGVDSGQCGIFDDAIYPKLNDDPAFESFYGECCRLTLGEGSAGILENNKGAVSASGYGDGSYALRYASHDGQVIGLLLDYALGKMGSVMRALVSRQQDEFST